MNPAQEESGSWEVRSPTGLVFEFPASEFLINWSAVVDNPGPYQVSKGGQEWISLADFLRLVRQGNRSTVAFRSILQGQTAPMTEQATNPSTPDRNAGPGSTSTPSSRTLTTSTHPTTQFQIKLKKEQGTGRLRWVFLAIGLILLTGGAFVAAYFLKWI